MYDSMQRLLPSQWSQRQGQEQEKGKKILLLARCSMVKILDVMAYHESISSRYAGG